MSDGAQRRAIGGGTLVVAAVVAIVALGRLRALTDPALFGHDEALYLVHGMVWAEGMLPYRDCWVNKPPLLTASFAAVHALFGASVTPHRVVQALTVVAACLVAARLAAAWRGRDAAIAAGVSAALLASTQLPPEDMLPCLAEPLFLVPLALSALLLLRRPEGQESPRAAAWSLFGAGAALGCAALIRQNALLLLPLYLAGAVLQPGLGAGTSVFRRAGGAAALLAGMVASALPWALLLREVTPEVVFWTWTLPRAGHRFDPGALLGAGTTLLGPHLLLANPGVVGLAALGLGLGVRSLVRRDRGPAAFRTGFLVAWGLAAVPLSVLGGRPYPHYLVMLAPGLGVLAGAGWVALRERIRSDRGRRGLLAIAGVYVLGAVGLTMVRNSRWDGHEDLDAARRSPLLQSIWRSTRPHERITVIGACPSLYYRARRLPAAPDVSGEILFMRWVPPGVRLLEPPGPGGRPTPYGALLLEGIARRSSLVIDLTPLPAGATVAGQQLSWFAMGALEDLPALSDWLRTACVAWPEPVEGARVLVPR